MPIATSSDATMADFHLARAPVRNAGLAIPPKITNAVATADFTAKGSSNGPSPVIPHARCVACRVPVNAITPVTAAASTVSRRPVVCFIPRARYMPVAIAAGAAMSRK